MNAIHPIMAQALAPVMPSRDWSISIDYKKGASWSSVERAPNEAAAIRRAIQFATRCGYTEAVKKAIARPA